LVFVKALLDAAVQQPFDEVGGDEEFLRLTTRAGLI
jgi:hypothetical protein